MLLLEQLDREKVRAAGFERSRQGAGHAGGGAMAYWRREGREKKTGGRVEKATGLGGEHRGEDCFLS
eukprot:6178112-Pleurochrysis_carterae.AAC.2